jgi:hypothetical protein
MKSGLQDRNICPAAGPLPPRRRAATSLPLVLIGFLSLGLSGCAAKRLQVDFTGFEKTYAETSNREVLLNLARLDNRDPTYFFKIGQITSSYKMAASVAGNASYALQTSNVAIGSPTGGGNPGVTYENDPIFTFIPVNDETNAQLLLKPVPAETFYFLYEQGWRVDQLLRLMVDRIELTRVSKQDGTCSVETFRNAPPTVYLRSDGSPDTEYLRDQATLSGYVTFLRINAVVYWLQKHGYLLLRGKNTFVPYSLDADSGLDDGTASASNRSKPGGSKASSPDDSKSDDGMASSSSAPKGTDFVNAAQKNAVWQHDAKTKKWLLGEKVFNPIFSLYPLHADGSTLVPDVDKIKKEILDDPDMKELREGPALGEVLAILSAGFTVEGSATQQNQQDNCETISAATGVSAHLVMRSLIGLMAAAAQEQAPYEALEHANPVIPPSSYLTPEQRATIPTLPRFNEAVPAVERIALLSLTGPEEGSETEPVIQLSYRGKTYRIADEKSRAGTDNQYWNRDVFRLINQLTSQVTVDITKFPLTEILQ